MALIIYGVPLSQPFRSVIWALLQKQQHFKIQIIVPGATNKMGSLHESFLAKTRGRTGVVPVLEDESTIISESPAILAYLCESRASLADLYGKPGTPQKAQIDSYMHWHHGNTRQIADLTMPYLRPELHLASHTTGEAEERAHKVLQSLDQAWLKDDEFIAYEKYSIADILAYEEVVQSTMTGVIGDLSVDYPNLKAWMTRMERMPFHDEAHVALQTLGSLSNPSDDTPIMKRLGSATKEGMKAIQAAQDSYMKV
jgi:glutathione S-transferase